MNHQYNTRLTLEQKLLMRQAQQYLDAHGDEIDAASDTIEAASDTIDAAWDAVDAVQNIEIPDMAAAEDAVAAVGNTEIPDTTLVEDVVDAADEAFEMGSLVEPIVEQIRQAAGLGKLRLNIVDRIGPNLDILKPPSFKFGITPPTLPTFKVPMPDLRVLPDLKVITPPTFPVPASAQLGLDLPKSLRPELPGMDFARMIAPTLEQIGVARFKPMFNMPAIDALKASYSWEAAVPRIDLSAYSHVHAVAASVSSMVSGLADQIAPMSAAINSLSGMITSLLDDWRWLADVGHRVARSGVSAALAARQAAINGETEAVEHFARKWLGIAHVTLDVLEAVVAALLEWSVDFVGDAIDHLGKLVKRHRRGHRLIGDTQLGGRRIDSLNREIIQPTGDVTELVALVAAPDLDFSGHEFTDPRCLALLDGLTPDEREIVLAKVSRVDKVITWEQAAQDCGFPASRGESVRRKVGRLKKKIDPEAS